MAEVGGPAVLRAAAVIGKRDQQRLALGGALGGAAVELLELILQLIERVALLVDTAAEPAAFAGRVGEDREEARAFAAHAARLRHQLVDLELLPVDRVFGLANLVGAGRIIVAAIEGAELADQALAGRATGGGLAGRLLRERNDGRRQQNCCRRADLE